MKKSDIGYPPTVPNLYRAVDKFGDTFDFMLSERRDEAAATSFSNKQSTLTSFLKKS
jgi:transposase-like protein